jgi:hypothetical protein
MSVTITALTSLDQNSYTTTDFSAVKTEYMIDTAINTVNQLAGQSIQALSGSPGTKSTTCTRAQEPALTYHITITLREAKKTSLSNSATTTGTSSTNSSITLGPFGKSEGGSIGSAISATSALNSADSPTVKLFYNLIDSLKIGGVTGRAFVRA